MTEVTGHIVYRDTTTAQHKDVADKFRKLFKEVRPAQILEIGTLFGGFTLLIRDILDDIGLNNTDIRTYDIIPNEEISNARHSFLTALSEGVRIDFRIKNVFDPLYQRLEEIEEITQFIHRDGPTIILCDGGSKQHEVRALAPYLRKGDIIMAHDYCRNKEYFDKFILNKVWNWLEIQDSDVLDTLREYNLEPFMQDELQEVLWMCRKKIS